MKLLGVICLVVTLTNALVVIDSTLASSCIYYLNTFDWGCGHGTGMKLYSCRCANLDWLGSVANCIIQESDSDRLKDHAMRHVSGRCKSKAGLDFTVDDFYNWLYNSTPYLQDAKLGVEMIHPVRTNTSEWEYYHKSFKDFAFEVEKSQWFGWGLVFYWGTIMFCAFILNMNEKFIGLRLNTNWLKRNISIPATFPGIKNNEQVYFLWKILPFSIPTRIESLIIILFIVQVFITSSVGYSLKLPNAFINNRWYMNVDLISYRTDMMAISLFPVIYLFGIRNNPFIPLTGISFATFTKYHRWSAIVMFCLSFVHSIIWTVDAIKDGGYKSWVVDLYFQYGIAATTIALLLIFHSGKVFRDLLYELFLIFHKLFNTFFIVTMYYHCNTLGWMGWIWSMVGILAYDRVMRWFRIILSGGLQDTKMTRCENDVIRLVLDKPRFWKYTPGSYAFIYFMSPWYYGWQSHPFTVISSPLEVERGKLVVYFQLQKGITRKLLQKLIKLDDQEMSIKIILEGPYGDVINKPKKLENNNMKRIGLAGGLGAVSIFPHLVKLLQDEPIVKIESLKFPMESHSTLNVENDSKLKFYWIISDLSNVVWFKKELEWLTMRNCQILIIVTGGENSQLEKNPFNEVNSILEESKLKVVHSSRPDFYNYISKDFEESSTTSQDMEIIACGPSSFNDDLRFSIVKLLKDNKNSKINLEYRAESFTW